jgi:hypothetical protein
MFLNIDKNCGGKLVNLKREPDDDDLGKYLIGKSMTIVIGMMEAKTETETDRNYLAGVSPNGQSKSQEKRVEAQKKKPVEDDEDLDIPF